MNIVTCVTPEAEKRAKKHNRLDRLQRLLHKITEDQSLALLMPFSDKRFFKKRLGGSDYRILFSRHIYQDHIVLCAYNFLSRGNHDYDNLWKKIDARRRDTREADALYKSIEIENHNLFTTSIQDYRYNPMPPAPPAPSVQEDLWLARGGKITQKIMVIESEKWIKAYKKDDFIRSGNAIHHQLEKVYEKIDDACSYRAYDIDIPYLKAYCIDGEEDFRIHLQYFPDHQLLFLLDLTSKRIEKPIQGFDPDSDWETLVRQARRAYPLDVFLLESRDFAKVQSEKESNLALSSEEIGILNQVHSSKNRFPLFINGRAGTGKSTILQYLLKDYLYLAIEHWDAKAPYAPLYLTYSKKLLDSATAHLSNLLESNAKILLKQGAQWNHNYLENKKAIFNVTFKQFQCFMLELLPEETRKRFQEKRKVDYAKFKQQWNSSIGMNGAMRHYGVDLVWHVIRTYIKGMSDGVNTYFSPENYAALPNKYKSVNDETFDEIYHRLWNNWYRKLCEEQRLWDEQDLALTVLAEADFPQCYPAIFCDEAQDFTVIELKILYYLSLFSERTVPDHSIGGVPFVFAGDPLQTLNPTGFRWEAVKSSFYMHLLKPIVKRTGKKSKADINYKELLSNYRSSKNIVDFCNSIQLLRLGLFGNTYQIQAQDTWFLDEGMTPFIYSVYGVKADELLKKDALVVIPNCHENEEVHYIDNDPILKRCVDRDEETGISSTVFSPSAAKGLEYDEIVVLYCFGASCPKSLLDRLQGKTRKYPKPAVTIEWEYFLNRLYVAASRAKKKLVILDDPNTFHGFWRVMQNIDAEQLNELLGTSINDRDWKGDKLLAPKEGTRKDMEDLLQGRDSNDSKELAEKYYREGMDTESASLLRRARLLFQRLEQKAKASECYAYALKIEGNYTKAAIAYLEIDEYPSALDCLWQTANFSRIATTNWFGETANDLRIALASHLERQKKQLVWGGDLATTKKILRRFENAITNLAIDCDNQGWRRFITIFLNWFKDDDEQDRQLQLYWGTLNDLAKQVQYPSTELAKIAYNLKLYTNAQSLWEAAGKTGHKDYYLCVYHNTTWPETLFPLKRLQKFETIIQQWQDRGKHMGDLNEELAFIVIEAMIKTNKLVQATHKLKDKTLVNNVQSRKQLSTLLWQQVKKLLKQSSLDVVEAISVHITALIDTQTWVQLPLVLSKVDDFNKALTQAQHHRIDQHLMDQFAYNPNLAGASETDLEVLSKIVHERFWTKEERWLSILEHEIGIAVTGAAIERTKDYTQAIDFYYWLTRYAQLRSAEQNFFDIRMAACIQKQADHRRQQGKPVEQEEKKLDALKKKLQVDFLDPDPEPDLYPGDEILPPWKVGSIREAQKPTSNAENNAKRQLEECSPKQDERCWLQNIKNYTEILAEQEKWHKLAQNWCEKKILKKRFPDSSSMQRSKALDVIIEAIVEPLAFSESIAGNQQRDRMQLSKLLIEQLKDKEADNTWTGCDRLKMDYDLVGACLERIGRYIDGQSFYEWALQEARTRKERKYMAERLVAVLERYIAYLLEDGGFSADKKAQELRQKASQLREDYRFRDKKLPRDPDL